MNLPPVKPPLYLGLAPLVHPAHVAATQGQSLFSQGSGLVLGGGSAVPARDTVGTARAEGRDSLPQPALLLHPAPRQAMAGLFEVQMRDAETCPCS